MLQREHNQGAGKSKNGVVFAVVEVLAERKTEYRAARKAREKTRDTLPVCAELIGKKHLQVPFFPQDDGRINHAEGKQHQNRRNLVPAHDGETTGEQGTAKIKRISRQRIDTAGGHNAIFFDHAGGKGSENASSKS